MRKVLSCVARLNGGFGRKRIALCLVGSDAREVVDAGLHRVSTFGALRGRPVAWVLDVLGTLEAVGLVEAEGDEYPCLRITAAGREVMLDRARMQAALPAERAASSGGKRVRVGGSGGGGGGGGGRGAAEVDDEPIDEPLFARLRELRARLAKAEQLPAYCVFHDRTLAALARAAAGHARRDGGGARRRPHQAAEVRRRVPRRPALARRVILLRS